VCSQLGSLITLNIDRTIDWPVLSSGDQIRQDMNRGIGDLPRFEECPDWEYAMRIAVGLALYFRSSPVVPQQDDRPVDIADNREEERRPPVGPSPGINDADQVLYVRESVPFDRDITRHVADVLRNDPTDTKRQLNWHFRQGYWRRPTGSGNDPDCPKTVWVAPTIVRRDRMPAQGLPLGLERQL
jgi:hypothetical protein